MEYSRLLVSLALRGKKKTTNSPYYLAGTDDQPDDQADDQPDDQPDDRRPALRRPAPRRPTTGPPDDQRPAPTTDDRPGPA